MSGVLPLWLEAAATATLGAAVAWRWLGRINGEDADFTSGAAAADIRAEWEGVSKTPGGRVDRASFKSHCLEKHAAKLTPASSEVYTVRPGGRTCLPTAAATAAAAAAVVVAAVAAAAITAAVAAIVAVAAVTAYPPPRCHGVTSPTPLLPRRHAPPLSAQVFLDRLFATGTGLMLTPGVAEKADLGRHCFSYCNMIAGEFYFQQAADAAADAQPAGSAKCDYSRQPVADVLQLVPPKK